MNTAEDIKAWLTNSFSFYFKPETSYDINIYKNPLTVEAAKTWAGFSLSDQATKYQNVLVGLSLTVLLVSILDRDKIPIIVDDLAFDLTIKVILSFLITVMIISLLIRFIIDRWLHKLDLAKYKPFLDEVTSEATRSDTRVRIDNFYWSHICNSIDAAFHYYQALKSGKKETQTGFDLEVPEHNWFTPAGVEIDLENRKTHVSNILCQLKMDCEEFSKNMSTIPEGDSLFLHAEKSYNKTLSKWIEGKNGLIREYEEQRKRNLDVDMIPLQELHRLNRRLNWSKRANLWIITLEILIPIALSISALISMWL